jgi:hypothetical protein
VSYRRRRHRWCGGSMVLPIHGLGDGRRVRKRLVRRPLSMLLSRLLLLGRRRSEVTAVRARARGVG